MWHDCSLSQRNEVTKRALRLEVGAEGGGFDKIWKRGGVRYIHFTFCKVQCENSFDANRQKHANKQAAIQFSWPPQLKEKNMHDEQTCCWETNTILLYNIYHMIILTIWIKYKVSLWISAPVPLV